MSRDSTRISENACTIVLNGEQALMLSQKAVFLMSDKVLLLSDLHIGKSSHFEGKEWQCRHRCTLLIF
ncbi:MAG: hypothetical protein IPG99_13870 [Ignavibacteria bacterium]|nr:hypothetical protein [Ignavibacteria bacterium]